MLLTFANVLPHFVSHGTEVVIRFAYFCKSYCGQLPANVMYQWPLKLCLHILSSVSAERNYHNLVSYNISYLKTYRKKGSCILEETDSVPPV